MMGLSAAHARLRREDDGQARHCNAKAEPTKIERKLRVALHYPALLGEVIAVRIPRSISSGGGGQPGTVTSTGITFETPPQVA
jgi:hypothetical protein